MEASKGDCKVMPEHQPEEESGWILLMQFLDGSPSFAHGFECGRWWEILKKEYEGDITVANDNQDQMLMMLNKLGYVFDKLERYDENWSILRGVRVK